MSRLSLFLEGKKIKVFQLGKAELAIGRTPDNAIHLAKNNVSRLHAKIHRIGGRWMISDMNSTNGTRVNNIPIKSHFLSEDDKIEIGDFYLHFEAPLEDKQKYLSSEYTIALETDPHIELDNWQHVQPGRTDSERAKLKASFYLVVMLNWIISRLPILHWASYYKKEDFRGDLSAGITITAMLIPQSMAYAMLAGLPPIYGLYASIAPPLIYALFGTSRQLSVAPVALDSLLVAAGVGAMAQLGTEAFVAIAIVLAFMIGLIQLVMSMLRLGFIVNFLSYPVLTGFTTAAALIIAFSQLKHLLGISLPQTHHLHTIIWSVSQQINKINLITLSIGVGSIVVISLLKRWNRKFPGAIAVVVVSTVLVWLFELDQKGVKIVGAVPSGLPSPGVPDFSAAPIQMLLPLALTIALIGFTESISVAKAFAAKNQYRIDANQEMFALGMANLAGSLFKGYPVAGGISRSAVNAQAGAQTGLASIITAILIAVTLMLLTPLFYYLPNAVLAAIIMTAVGGLIDTKEMRYLFKVKKSEGGLLILTVLATLSLGITMGLLIGMIGSILLFVALNTRPNTAILGRLPGTDIFRNIDHFPEADLVPGLVILRIDDSFYFANTEFLKEKLYELVESNEYKFSALILDATSVNDLDSSADTALREVVDNFKKRGIEIYIAGVKAPVREVMKRSGLYQLVGGDHFFYTIDAAVKRYESKSRETPVRGECLSQSS